MNDLDDFRYGWFWSQCVFDGCTRLMSALTCGYKQAGYTLASMAQPERRATVQGMAGTYAVWGRLEM